MKKIIIAIALTIASTLTLGAEPVKDSMCAPTSAASIKMGTVGNDIWSYWWCRNSTDVWAVWVTWLELEWKSNMNLSAQNFMVSPSNKFLVRNDWQTPIPLDASGVPQGRQHLWTAAKAAIDADTTKPAPGVPNTVPTTLPELWVVTPNGSSFQRKTSKVVGGVVQAYGTGTQTVRIGTVCNHTATSYPLGSTTKYIPLYSGPTDEVISCIKIQ